MGGSFFPRDVRAKLEYIESVKIVHAADIHIDSPLRGLSRYEGAPAAAMRGATRRAFSKLIDHCIELRAELLLLAGDIYDGDAHDYNTAAFFNAELARLRPVGTRVVLLLGNHDAASILTKTLPLPAHATRLDERAVQTVLFEDLGVAVHGQSFAKRVVKEDLAARYPVATTDFFNIGMLHTSLDGREGHDPYAPTLPATLKGRGYDYFALGHVHAREIVSRDPYIAYPGNLQGRHVRETGAKGALLIDVRDGGGRKISSVEPLICDVLRWEALSIDATNAEHRDDLVQLCTKAVTEAAARTEGRPLAARVVITGTTPRNLELRAAHDYIEHALRSELGNAADDIWLEKVAFKTREPSRRSGESTSDELLRLIAGGTPDGAAAAAAVYSLLPPEARKEAEGDVATTEFFEELYEDARALLLTRLEHQRED